jgi:Ca2+-binding RTX toxin-like protein
MAAPGSNTVRSSIGFSLAVSAQCWAQSRTWCWRKPSPALAATGNGLANVLTGNSFANVLDGGGGADTMRGGAGNDVYVVNDVLDIVDELSNGGAGVFDMVRSSISFSLVGSAGLQGAVENLVLTGSAVSGTGNALRNAISGNTAANLLDGRSGSDSLQGGLGNDVFVFSTALGATTNLDSVVDFGNAAGNNDSFRLDHAIFTALADGGRWTRSFSAKARRRPTATTLSSTTGRPAR